MKKKQKGIIGTIVLIIVALIVLGYYNISVKAIAESPFVQENLRYTWELLVKLFTFIVDNIKGFYQ